MRINEAFEILEIDKGSSKEAIAKAYKKALAANHPDKFTDEVEKEKAEVKFKKIQTAYNLIKDNPFGVSDGSFSFSFFTNGGGASTRMNSGAPVTFVDLSNLGKSGLFRRQTHEVTREINATTVSISFEESILGCVKQVEIKDKARCKTCNGKCFIVSADECDKCNGTGKIDKPNEDPAHIACVHCKGMGNPWSNCDTCNGLGVEETVRSYQIKLNPGVANGETIKLIGATFNNTTNLVRIKVEPHIELSRTEGGLGNNVVSVLEISLLEALKGGSKLIKTVKGDISLKIPAEIKHNQDLRIRGFGVLGKGDHLITIKIEYPKNKDKLIEFLESESE